MVDVSSVSGSGGTHPSQNIQNQPAAPAEEAAPTNAADFDAQQDDALNFLQQQLTQALAMQKVNLR
ncbi:hypothetical protein [Simkania negevensis]|uniref:Uncharacterized protein n=1 Tax=Simkania negevensis (strain ATCC VR-1471 / DSM 27360 / Z) TaxID=331113 RepID=F8L3F8_SIMNZ|nr:hypothetical protein [Simkania negevensis]MCB1068207.1 hypothetical protein [Simkania sp.]MCB1074390.1 hypothetical protein [Simkania sp.]MCP5489543.1 hypothetical protein [Chlamydiales bacterium]CCB89812.1 unknown protein [Simkania negevensis Z]